ncbi:MAG: DUF1015 family protein, partial [Planctomycetes bacterium]|nr:DUF1015 family protein [Planctomycetota bacterium]
MPEVLPLDAILEPAGGGAREPPALLAYRQEFRTVGGLEKGRLALVAALPVGGNEASRVLVTQDVEPAGVERCLEEMASGGLQTAPVVAAVEDVDFQLEKLLERGVLLRERPDAQADLGEGERHRFWRVEDPRLIEEVQRFLRERDAFVIDGLAELRALRRLGGAASAAGGTPEP